MTCDKAAELSRGSLTFYRWFPADVMVTMLDEKNKRISLRQEPNFFHEILRSFFSQPTNCMWPCQTLSVTQLQTKNIKNQQSLYQSPWLINRRILCRPRQDGVFYPLKKITLLPSVFLLSKSNSLTTPYDLVLRGSLIKY